jgi:hypothetical protein
LEADFGSELYNISLRHMMIVAIALFSRANKEIISHYFDQLLKQK